MTIKQGRFCNKITVLKEKRYMAEPTKLCPICKEIMKPACYAVGKQDGTERLENKIFSYDGVVILGKLVICPKCGHLSTVKA